MPDQRNEKFPRSVELPIQSPLFWVEQKDRYLRQLLIRDIEELTNRRLTVYFANRFEAGSQIDGRDPAFMNELLGDINGQPTDLLLQTAGGVTDATEALVSMLDLAKHIVEQKSGHFDPSKFEDHYEAALQELLDKKQKGQPIAKMAPRTSAKVVNLMDALRASLNSSDAKAAASKKTKAKPVAKRKAGLAGLRHEAL